MVWDLETLKKLNEKAEGKAEKRYVVVDAGEWTSSDYAPKFFKDFNTCNGFLEPIFTDYLQHATLFSKDGIEDILKLLPTFYDWEIWSVKPGIILDDLYKEVE